MNRSRLQQIDTEIRKLLRGSGCVEPPIDVEGIASFCGIDVRRVPAENELSGFLVKHAAGKAVMGVNAMHHGNRQRFTIGHEIGHFVLHDCDKVHVDKDRPGIPIDLTKFGVKLRDTESSKGEDPEEVEANAFAAALLMPTWFLAEDLPRFAGNGILDDGAMTQLAKRYRVSVTAMTNRLVSLGFIYENRMS